MNAAVESILSIRQEHTLPGQGTPWLDALRDAAHVRFNQIGLPTLQDEDWRYTNLRSMLRQEFVPVDASIDEVGTQLPGISETTGIKHRMVFINGRYSDAVSSTKGLPKGVTLVSMATALVNGDRRLENVLGSCTPEDGSGFSALNTAFIEDGVYLDVEDGVVVEDPVEILFLSAPGNASSMQPRNLYVLGKSSRVQIVERFVSTAETAYFNNAVSELIAADSARVEHTRLQEEGGKAFHVGGLFVQLHRDSTLISNNVALGAALARTDLLVSLKAPGADCQLNGIYVGNKRQHIDNFTQVDHEHPECRSDEFYKGVLDDRARAVFRGRVVVHQDAQKTDAQQQNRNLLLSEDAEIDTKPQLEIYADDVKCSHGATVGQLDENALFYLRSRGIDEVTARSFLTYAFAADVLDRFSLSSIRAHIEAALSKKLFEVDRLEELV